jgi:hypothetical protein
VHHGYTQTALLGRIFAPSLHHPGKWLILPHLHGDFSRLLGFILGILRRFHGLCLEIIALFCTLFKAIQNR